MTDSIEAENGSGDRELVVEGRLENLEIAVNEHNEWLIRLDKCKTVFRLEERIKAVSEQIDVLEGRKGQDTEQQAPSTDVEQRLLNVGASINELSKDRAKIGALTRDIQGLKAALGKHVHLPDGQIGLPLNLNLK